MAKEYFIKDSFKKHPMLLATYEGVRINLLGKDIPVTKKGVNGAPDTKTTISGATPEVLQDLVENAKYGNFNHIIGVKESAAPKKVSQPPA